MASSIRALKISQAILRSLSSIFNDDFGYAILIMNVRVSKDLKYSDVFLYKDNTINPKELNRVSGFLQHKLTKYINFRHVPKLRFHVTDVGICSEEIVELKNDESGE